MLEVDEDEGTHSSYDGLEGAQIRGGRAQDPDLQLSLQRADGARRDHGTEGYVWKRKHGGRSGFTGKLLPAYGPVSAQEVSDAHTESCAMLT